VADEECLPVVVRVNEPAGDAVYVVAADFAGAGVEDVDAADADLDGSGRPVRPMSYRTGRPEPPERPPRPARRK
jgi:hypothetical protein